MAQKHLTTEARIVSAQVYLHRNNFLQAENEIQIALSVNEKSLSAQNTYATIKIEQEEYAEAKIMLENVIRENSDFWKAYFNLGVINFRQEKYQDALRMFWRSLILNKDWKSLEWVLVSFLTVYNNYSNVALAFCIFIPLMKGNLWSIPLSVIVGLYYWFWGTYRVKAGDLWYSIFNYIFGTLILLLHAFVYWTELRIQF